MKGIEIINQMRRDALGIAPDVVDKVQFLAMEAQMKMFEIHARALGCVCECFGLNAEAMAGNQAITSAHYIEVMTKWDMVNEKGEILI